jgi:serine/threonine protein kinase
MVTGTMPFDQCALVNDSVYKYIVQKNYKKFWKLFEDYPAEGTLYPDLNLSNDLKDLIVSMLSHCYTQRPDIQKIKEHPWFK